MHIVLVMDQYDKQNNGTTVTTRRLAESLRAGGHMVTILAGGEPEAGKVCVKKHTIPFFQRLIESQGMCFAKPDAALYHQAFQQADIVHFFMPFRFCRKGEQYARQMHIPCVAGFHVQPENITSTLFLNQWKWPNTWLYQQFLRRFYSRFAHIHCPSQFVADQLA
ncbi:MAG: glycosyltransferase, partial [Oscillospiraceae bacterium]